MRSPYEVSGASTVKDVVAQSIYEFSGNQEGSVAKILHQGLSLDPYYM